MPKLLNTALGSLRPSGIRRINALAAQRPGCIALALGEPDFGTPAPIVDAAALSLASGATHYPPNAGTPELRRALARYMAASGLAYEPDEVVVTCGATEALAATFAALLNPGDEVAILTPAFGLYESLALMNHAVPVPVDTEPHGFQIDEAALRRRISPATKAIVLCSPGNPTGCVLSTGSLDAIARLASETGIYVVCDDVYNRLVYTGGYARFAALHGELRDRIVVVDSFSKPWAMTGWRLGWVAACADVASEIAKAHQFTVSSVPAFEMPAAECALTCDPAPMLEAYRARRERVMAALRDMGLPLVEPAGAFYAFPNVGRFGLPSDAFCERAIEEAGVALVPGTCFGCEGYVRLSYCVADEDLDEGLRRLASFVARLSDKDA
ncbi:pyridoxal phosphate-dependent aminotransferase [Collinsella phocaeensis]|uniref:pyridoxal phosphate-dependent aminotransferase n=1 Tax=Collinsella phocaeensis TaxID=1871016 RepID=UPI000A6D057F|nr:aminotransferase class I/II-fold pyridoxal phosphate-dependent enzyme [Collinsella phocaeensis]